MKNSLKMIPVIAGMSLALLGSVNEVKASTESTEESSSAVFGYCDNSSRVCGTTSQGTTLYGRWNEGD